MWGNVGINCAHSPTCLRPDGVMKPLWEGERSVRAAEDPCSGRGLGVAGPGLRWCPVTRVRWQDFLATWPAGGPAVSSQVDRAPAYEKRGFPKTARTSATGPSG